MKRVVILLALGACTDEPIVPVEPANSTFLRLVPDPEREARGQLETALVSYRDPKGRMVDLIAAVHIGDRDYYEALNRSFESYDRVLFEGVAPDARHRPSGESDSFVSGIQRVLGRVMNLVFQLDTIDYSKANFVHADLTTAEFNRLWNQKGESMWKLVMRLMAAQSGSDADELDLARLVAMLFAKDRTARLKYYLAEQFQNLDLTAGLETASDGSESVLLGERNKVVIRVVQRELDAGHERLAVFYGAAHMPDLEERLQRGLGFEKVGQRWLAAWRIE